MNSRNSPPANKLTAAKICWRQKKKDAGVIKPKTDAVSLISQEIRKFLGEVKHPKFAHHYLWPISDECYKKYLPVSFLFF